MPKPLRFDFTRLQPQSLTGDLGFGEERGSLDGGVPSSSSGSNLPDRASIVRFPFVLRTSQTRCIEKYILDKRDVLCAAFRRGNLDQQRSSRRHGHRQYRIGQRRLASQELAIRNRD